MIDFDQEFEKYEGKLTEYISGRISGYFSSTCHKKLKQRIESLRRSSLGEIGGMDKRAAGYLPKIAFPIVKERMLLRQHSLMRSFRGEPLFTVKPVASTTRENADIVQAVIEEGLRETRFREKCFVDLVDSVSTYGVAVSYTNVDDTKQVFPLTVADPVLGWTRKMVERQSVFCVNKPVNPLNYITNPNNADPEDSYYEGHIERVGIDYLIDKARRAGDAYIKKNLEKVIKDAKAGAVTDPYYHSAANEDWHQYEVDLTRMFLQIYLDGNEDSYKWYYAEMAGGKIIRFHEAPYDRWLRPYSVYTMLKRPEYFWGNTDAELVKPHENAKNMLLGVSMENAMKSLERYVFYDKTAFDIADINERHENNGWIGVEMKTAMGIDRLVHEYQAVDRSPASIDWLMRHIDENIQNNSPRPNALVTGTKSGLQNNTATSASILEARGGETELGYIERFAFGLKRLANIHAVLYGQYKPDRFPISTRNGKGEIEVSKNAIMGDFDISVETSLTTNKMQQLERLQNVMTTFINWRMAGVQEAAVMRFEPILRQLVKQMDIGVDYRDIFPQQITQEISSGREQGEAAGGAQQAAGNAGNEQQQQIPAEV